MKKIIVYIKYSYLPLSETFIYTYLQSINNYKLVVFSMKIENLNLFPYDAIYSNSENSLGEKFWNYIVQKGSRIFPCIYRYTPFYKQMIEQIQPSLIHAHFGMEGVQSLFLKKKYRIPLITTFYGHDLFVYPKKRYWRKAYKQLFKEGDIFLVEGNNMKHKLVELGCPEEKILIQHIGVDLEKLKYKKRIVMLGEKIRILFCGRIVEKKGLKYTLMALAKVIDRFKNIQLRIIGDGPLKKEMENLSNKLKLNNFVVFLGYCNYEEYINELENAHIFVAPSITATNGDSEGGAPTTIIEAQAVGLPVLSTYHCDIPEVVIDTKTGFLVSEKDYNGLAERLEFLLKNPYLWSILGYNGRKHVEENYNIKKEVKILEEIYDLVLQKYPNL